MKKVFQTIIDVNHGNCEQAVIASIFELPLEDIPNFIEYKKGKEFDKSLFGWLYKKGFSPCSIYKSNYGLDKLKSIAKFDGGYNGYLHALVSSQTFENVMHAVVVDTELNIVHDPNPNQLALNLSPEDIISIIVLKDMIIGKTGKLYTKEKWNLISEEEREANTYKVIYDENDKIIGKE